MRAASQHGNTDLSSRESAIRPTSWRHAPMLVGPGKERIMRNEIEHAWQKAADCAARAQDASDPNIREFFIRLRDSWIGAANRAEFIADGSVSRRHRARPDATSSLLMRTQR